MKLGAAFSKILQTFLVKLLCKEIFLGRKLGEHFLELQFVVEAKLGLKNQT